MMIPPKAQRTRIIGLLLASHYSRVVLASSYQAACSPGSFTFPELPGAEHQQISAAPVRNFRGNSGWKPEASEIGPDGVDVCNVTVTYSHPGHDDIVNIQVWLPLADWNERFVGVGGGGWLTGEFNDDIITTMASKGFAAATTDGGHEPNPFLPADAWMLKTPGNLNYPLLVNFAHRALHELSVIGKSIAEQYYGSKPEFSYWHGCSTGGRQGLALAQRYPGDFDGILATCPAVNFSALMMALYWPQVAMGRMGAAHYPPPCHFDALAAAAVEACDELDGLKDGAISAIDLCNFDPGSLVGKKIDCDGKASEITEETARVARVILNGPVDPDGERLFPGSTPGTAVVGLMALGNTVCDDAGNCSGRPFTLATDWIRLLVKKDPSFVVSSISHQEYADLFRQSIQELDGLIGTNDIDLRMFQQKGGKILSWHSINDEAITVKAMRDYYERVTAYDAARKVDTETYFRYFEVSGATHCSAPQGGRYPLKALEVLQWWVEQNKLPETLEAATIGVGGNDEPRKETQRPICKYPKIPVWKGGKFDCLLPLELKTMNLQPGRDEL